MSESDEMQIGGLSCRYGSMLAYGGTKQILNCVMIIFRQMIEIFLLYFQGPFLHIHAVAVPAVLQVHWSLLERAR